MGDICSRKNKGAGVEILGVGDPGEEFFRRIIGNRSPFLVDQWLLGGN